MRFLSVRFSSSHFLSSHFLLKRSNNRFSRLTMAKKSESGDEFKNGEFRSNLRFRPSKVFLFRSAIVVFGLGFIDAGYSGDWSRIGVISKEAEEILKNAAFFVVPFCILMIFLLSDEKKTV